MQFSICALSITSLTTNSWVIFLERTEAFISFKDYVLSCNSFHLSLIPGYFPIFVRVKPLFPLLKLFQLTHPLISSQTIFKWNLVLELNQWWKIRENLLTFDPRLHKPSLWRNYKIFSIFRFHFVNWKKT